MHCTCTVHCPVVHVYCTVECPVHTDTGHPTALLTAVSHLITHTGVCTVYTARCIVNTVKYAQYIIYSAVSSAQCTRRRTPSYPHSPAHRRTKCDRSRTWPRPPRNQLEYFWKLKYRLRAKYVRTFPPSV